MLYDLKDKKPKNFGENWIAPNAAVIGNVTLENNTSVWFNATIAAKAYGKKPKGRQICELE